MPSTAPQASPANTIFDVLANLGNWDPALYPSTYYLANDPSLPTTVSRLYFSDGETWVPVGGFSAGTPVAYCDGSDGPLEVTGISSLSRILSATTVHVAPGGVLNLNGGSFGIYARESIVVDAGGAINCFGTDATSVAGAPGVPLAGFYGGVSGGGGGNNSAGNNGSGVGFDLMVSPIAGDGGAGGTDGTNGGGPGGNLYTSPIIGRIVTLDSALLAGANGSLLAGGAAGGGGGSDNVLAFGGGGGGAPGVVFLAAPIITINGTIDVHGGAGAPGTGTAGNAGGGGGAGGGMIFFVCNELDINGATLNVSGGVGAIGFGAGAGGAGGALGVVFTFLNV